MSRIYLPERFGLPANCAVDRITAAHATLLESVDAECFTAEDPNEPGTINDILWDKKDFLDEIRKPRSFGHIVLADRAAIAYVLSEMKGDYAELLSCATRPAYRGKAFFTQMLGFLEAECRQNGIERIVLDTRTSDNPFYIGAQAAFEKRGFVIETRRNNHYDRGDHAYRMAKRVSRA